MSATLRPRVSTRSAVLAVAFTALVTPLVVAAPADPEERYRACMLHVEANAERALREARDWGRAGGGDPAGHCAAAAAAALGRWGEAADILQALAGGRTAARDPSLRASLLTQAAQARLAADEPEAALHAADLALAEAPRDPELHVLQGRALAGLGRVTDAIASFDRALAIDARSVDALVFRAGARRKLDELGAAETDLDAALALDPRHPEALLERGIVRRLAGDDIGAGEDWRTLIDSAPQTAAAESARRNLERMRAGG